MTASPDKLLAQLYDIRSLDSVSWWPLAPGWWVLIVLAVIGAAIAYWRHWAYERSWQGQTFRALRALNVRLAKESTQEIAGALSVLLRRVAMQSFSRAECAGLEGADWLRWLTINDPGGFDWTSRGSLLIEAPYAPPGRPYSSQSLKVLIDAAKRWVK
ncbi:MAG TPA: DUF4381 domain-containing protein [Rhizomicrobium sp.]